MDTVGSDVGSDHYLVKTRLRVKLKRKPREMKDQTRLQKLADEEMLVKYNIEVRNKFQALTELEEEKNADHMNNRMENIYVGAAKDVLGIAKRTSKPWLRGRDVEESRGKETTKAEVRKYTFRKSQEKNKRTIQGKRPRS